MEITFTKSLNVRIKYFIYFTFIISSLYGTASAKVSFDTKKINKEFNSAIAQTITFNAIPSKTYTDADFNPGATASSGLNVVYTSSNTAIARIVNGTIRIVGAGNVTITASQPGNAQYSAAPAVDMPLTVTKAPLSITANSVTRIYGVNNPALRPTYSGFKAGESANNLTGTLTITTMANLTSEVGAYGINISGLSSNNYDIKFNAGVILVTKAPLNILANNSAKTYGSLNPSLTLAYVGFKNGENSTVLLKQPQVSTNADINSTPGTYPITVSIADLISDPIAKNYQLAQVTNGTLTVNKATLTVAAVNKAKVYAAPLPEITFRITGFVLGQTESVLTNGVQTSTTAVQTSAVGNYPITVSGATAVNYNIVHRPGTLSVTKAPLRIIADNKLKNYGDDNPTLTFTYAGFVNSEDPSVLTTLPNSPTTAAAKFSSAGNYPITINGATAANYSIINVAGRLTIGKIPLTITAENKSRIYGEANPAFTVTYDGFINNETPGVLTAAPVASVAANVMATARVGNYPITVRGATAVNYAIKFVIGTLAINKAEVIVKANAITREYGSTTPAFTATYTGFVNNETAANLSKGPTYTSTGTTQSPLGTYVITPSNAVSANYNFVYETGELTIKKRTLTIVAANKTKGYGAAVPALTVTYMGLVNGDKAPAILTGAPSLSTTVTAASALGTYDIDITGNVTAANYDIAYQKGTLTVNQAIVRVIVVNKTKLYGQANPAFTFAYQGFASGEDASVLTTQPAMPTTTATETSPVGNYSITTTGGATADNYTFQYPPGRLTISKATLNVVLEPKTKMYGEADPEFTYTLNGFVNGDTEASITTMPTGTSTGNTAGRFTITSTGGSASNYTFRPVTAFLTVNKAPLTIAVENKTRAYGDPNGTFTAVYSSFVNGDTPASLTKQPTFTTAANASSVVGTYPVTAGGATSVNYNITYTLGTLTVDKTKLIVKADDKSVVYGAAIPAYTVTYNGFKNGDNETSLTTPATATASAAPGAGTYDITPSGATTDSRYDIEYIKGILTINKANLTVTAQNTTRVYGETNPTFNAVYSGFVNGETQAVINTPATGSTTATTASGVNNYTIDFTGAADDNYNFGYVPATLSVTPKALTITANNQSRRYGEANASFTALFDGFVNGDTEASLSTPLQYATTANQLSGIGTYPLTVSGATSGNYTIAFNPGAITIGRTPLRVTANNAIRNFDEANPALTLAYNGFVNGENENILNTKPTATTAANTSSPVGTYPIVVAGGVSDNYALSYTNGTLTVGEVSKPTLLITAKPATRAYGVTNPAFEVTYSGFVNGDTEANVTTKPQFDTDADLNSGVGTYNIRPKNAVSAKYNITYANGELTITKAELTARADNKIKVYGDANPAFSVSYTGFVNGETAAVLNSPSTAIVTAGVNALTSPGTYTITASGGSAANYNIAPASGTLTISQAPLRVTANNAIRNFGEANPALTVTYSGFVNGENENNISTKPTATTVANTSSPVGTYAIVAAGGVSDNYTFDYTGGTLTVGEISKPTLLITAKPATRAYGAADPAFEVTYSGFVNGDTEASMTTRPTFTTNATATSGMGLYTIVPKNAVNNNYNITYANSELTITKAGLIARADNKAKVYGDANPAFSVSYTGFVNGETVAVLTSASTASATGVTAASSAGNYPITASGGSANNYQLSYSPGTLTITKAPLTVTANNAIREFGVANPAFTVAYNGFVNGDNVNNLTTRPTVTTAANASSPVGTYPIVAAGGVSANYTFSYTDGTLTVGKPVLTITAKPATRAYGAADPAFEVTYSGFVNGDTETSMTTKPTFTTNATATSGTGLYVITPNGAVNNNYSLVYNTNTLTITKAQLTAKADNKSKAYGGANPTFTVAYTGFANGETASVLNSPSVASVAAAVNAATVPGNYIITASGGSAANYDISYTPGTLTINKAALSVIADNKSKVYGSANPAFTFAYSGFVNGESAAVLTATPTASVAMGVTAASGAGNYAITPVGGSAANYTLVYVPGTLTINKATLTVTADNATRAFGAVGPAFTVAYSGFVNGDTPASLTTQASGSTVATSASVAGTYPIAPVGATSPNYTFNYVNGVLTITPGTAVISFAVIPLKTFGNPDFDPAATTNVGEPVIYTSSNPAVATIVNNKVRIVGAGTTILTASISSTSGYSLTVPVTKSLEIYKASQSISFNNIPVIDRGGSYSLSNVTASSGLPVTLTINDNKIASIQGTTLSGVQIGNTTITATQPGNNNYLPANFVIQQVVVGPAAGQLEVQVHQAVSPNGDGINDVFLIEGITNHPDNRVTLINRNGLKVYEVMGYDNVNRVFNGRSNVTGNLLQQGTYFYQIQYIVNGKGRNLTGFFVLKY